MIVTNLCIFRNTETLPPAVLHLVFALVHQCRNKMNHFNEQVYFVSIKLNKHLAFIKYTSEDTMSCAVCLKRNNQGHKKICVWLSDGSGNSLITTKDVFHVRHGLTRVVQMVRTHRKYADAIGVSRQVEEVVREGQTQHCSNICLNCFNVCSRVYIHMDFRVETGGKTQIQSACKLNYICGFKY